MNPSKKWQRVGKAQLDAWGLGELDSIPHGIRTQDDKDTFDAFVGAADIRREVIGVPLPSDALRSALEEHSGERAVEPRDQPRGLAL